MISMREAYEKIGANYDDACARLMGEEMLARFALKFLDDESMDELEAAMAASSSSMLSSSKNLRAKRASISSPISRAHASS